LKSYYLLSRTLLRVIDNKKKKAVLRFG